MAHSSRRVNNKMFEEWIEKFPWLIVNNIKNTRLSSVKVFTCLACVDTMRVINTKMLADKQRKLLDLFTVYQKSFVLRKYPITKNAPGIKICDTQLKSPILN